MCVYGGGDINFYGKYYFKDLGIDGQITLNRISGK